jgi:putative PEP-CTERM system histidine kinase
VLGQGRICKKTRRIFRDFRVIGVTLLFTRAGVRLRRDIVSSRLPPVPGTLAYLLTTAAALTAFVVLLARSRSGDITRRGALACAITAAWALILAGQSYVQVRDAWIVLLAEALRYGAWFAVLSSLATSTPRWFTRGAVALTGGLVLYAAFGWGAAYAGMFSLPLGGLLESFGLVLAFTGLVLTEQVLRNSPALLRDAFRFCAIGIGGPFAFDLFLFSQAQLLGAPDADAWALRGVIISVLLLPFVVGARRMPVTEARLFVSRHVVFYSSAFIAVGLYLCLMALGGYYVRYHGGSWGNALQVLFLCGAAAILAWLLLSESPLRRLRVFIATHFYRNKYDYRVEWMRFVQTLAAPEESDVNRTAIRAVAQIFGSDGGLLMLREEDSDRFRIAATWPESAAGISEHGAIGGRESLPSFLRERQWVVDLREYREQPGVYGKLELPDWLLANSPWRVITPLLVGDELIGFLVLRAPPDPFSMNFEDRDLLKILGRNVAVQIAQHRADEKLAQGRQFDAYNRFAAFVMHDLKNAVAQLQLLVTNAARHRNNPVFVDDAIDTIQNTSERMTRLIEQLQSRDVQGMARNVDLVAVARAAVARGATREPRVVMEEPDRVLTLRADPERLGAVLDHAIRNAQEATPASATVTLRIDATANEALLHIIDEGAGMEAEFVRQRLFRPFDSTKGSKGMGIGAYQTREYARWLGGDVEVQSTPGKGTDFCIRLPLCQTTNPDC